MAYGRGNVSFGRTVIYTGAKTIDDGNICDELAAALSVHAVNRGEIQYLYDYRRGKQPILGRTKEIRPEICNRVVENRADEIVTFKAGYQTAEPCQYVARADKDISDAINYLNDVMYVCDKEYSDDVLVDWFFTCGTAYRMILPRAGGGDEDPLAVYTLDPRDAFVVYSRELGHRPMMGVTVAELTDGRQLACVYTDSKYYEITDDVITHRGVNLVGTVPIIEYPANTCRIGAFEIVLPLLDAINNVESNRLDGVEQFIQALLVLKGVDVEEDSIKKVKELGGLGLPSEGDAFYLTQALDQAQTQTLKDDMYQAVLTICGMPNRNGGSSTSDTGAAVTMRDGWSEAESRAKRVEKMFRRSEKRFLRIALRLLRDLKVSKLELSDVDIRCPRRNYENVQEKAQVLTTMLASDMIHPKLAFEHSGLFVDPELAYTLSRQYAEEQAEKEAEELRKLDAAAVGAAKTANGQTEETGDV